VSQKPSRAYEKVNPDTVAKGVAFYDEQMKKGEPWKKKAVAKKFGIPPISFANYAHDDHSMQAKIGAKVGRPSNVTKEDREEFMVQLLVRADRANEGLTCKDASDTLVTLTERTDKPLNEKQAARFVYTTLRTDKHLKKNLVVPQKTTSKRSMSSVAQQWRWHQNVTATLDLVNAHTTAMNLTMAYLPTSTLPAQNLTLHVKRFRSMNTRMLWVD
jgi:hypothetical protein